MHKNIKSASVSFTKPPFIKINNIYCLEKDSETSNQWTRNVNNTEENSRKECWWKKKMKTKHASETEKNIKLHFVKMHSASHQFEAFWRAGYVVLDCELNSGPSQGTAGLQGCAILFQSWDGILELI